MTDLLISYRKICLKEHNLEFLQFYTLPSYTWAAFTKDLDYPIEYICDSELYSWIEGMRVGGICFSGVKKYAKANNPLLDNYDPKLPVSYINYLDACQLYGYSMTNFYLPTTDHHFLTEEQIEKFEKDVKAGSYMSWTDEYAEIEKTITKDNFEETRYRGFFIQCTISIPEALHDKFKNLPPPGGEKLVITEDFLSPLQLEIKNKVTKTGKPQPKVVPNLFKKEAIKLHYTMLQFMMQHGCILESIESVVSFVQAPVMRKYIGGNAKSRKKQKTAQGKAYYKALSNLAYGRCMLNSRKYKNVKLVTNKKEFERETCKSTFDRYVAYSKSVGLVYHKSTHFKANQMVFLGSAILSISKVVMFRFIFDVFYPLCERAGAVPEILYFDTDGTKILTTYPAPDPAQPQQTPIPSIYRDMFNFIEHFDFSDMPLNHPFYTQLSPEQLKVAMFHREHNKKRMGCFTEELPNCEFIDSFISLRSKCYSIKTNKRDVKKCGGITVRDTMTDFNFETYRSVITREKLEIFTKQKKFASTRHELMLQTLYKKSLSSFDDKFFLLPNGNDALPHGHKDIPRILENWPSSNS